MISVVIPTLETERLRLRPLRAEDFEAEAPFYASDRSRFVGGPVERPAAWRMFATVLGHWTLRGFGYWGVEDKETGLYCGRVGLWEPEGWPEPELGWQMVGGSEGKGYAFEAAVEVRRHAYETLGWGPLISSIDPENTRSIRLAERLGAVRERSYPLPDWGPIDLYRHPDAAALAQARFAGDAA